MSKLRIQRHKHYVAWKMGQPLDYPYPAEAAMVDRLRSTGNCLFVPYPFPYTDDSTYHYHLAFLVEAVDLLPLKMDLSFDAVWRAFESIYKHSIDPRDYKLNQEAPVIAAEIDANSALDTVLDLMFSSIPIQGCEYLVKRIFDQWNETLSDWEKIWKRLNNRPDKHTEVMKLLREMAAKYGAPKWTDEARRKAARLLRIAITGVEVDVNGAKILLPRNERISFLLNALLYTYRNDRFHGSMQPPFKSSKGTLRTYTHAHYCFLWGHFLFLWSLAKVHNASVQQDMLAENARQNLEAFSELYGKSITA